MVKINVNKTIDDYSEDGLMFVWCLCVADLPTCLLCVCLTGSVYCEEVSPDMTSVPTLPKETAYLYARFNKIKKISTKDFAEIGKLEVNALPDSLIRYFILHFIM